jgi:hypothetical protein
MAFSEGAIRIEGLAAFRAELRAIDAGWGRALTKANKEIGDKVAQRARGLAGNYGRMTAAAASSIRPTATQTAAKIAAGGNPGFALAAIYGAKRHSGWYGNARHHSATTPQFPEWVGNAWEVGGSGGPRGINDAVREMRDEIPRLYEKAITELTAAAFH